jgi:hypothetical protein
MSAIRLREPLASQIQHEADSYGLAVEQLIETAVRHYRFQTQREKLNAEKAWWNALAPEKRARYWGGIRSSASPRGGSRQG